jgi:hypothetical protein
MPQDAARWLPPGNSSFVLSQWWSSPVHFTADWLLRESAEAVLSRAGHCSSAAEPRDKARQLVHDRICQQVSAVLSYSDFLVLDEELTVSVQPAVPMLSGYTAYWPFRPDIETIQRRQQEGKAMNYSAIRGDDYSLLNAAERYFGSWRKALLAAGVVLEGRGK